MAEHEAEIQRGRKGFLPCKLPPRHVPPQQPSSGDRAEPGACCPVLAWAWGEQ